jgi:hypothetical protein
MAIDKIQSESINLADNFAFTGTVTGTPTGLSHFQVFNKTSDQSVSADTNTTITWTGESTHQPSVGSTLASVNSGIFSFSQTGIYMVNANITVQMNANDGHSRKAILALKKTTNNSTYTNEADAETSIPNTDGGELNKGNLTGQFLVDITDTTNDKFLLQWFLQSNACSIKTNGTTNDRTIVQIARISDT